MPSESTRSTNTLVEWKPLVRNSSRGFAAVLALLDAERTGSAG